MIFMVQFLGMAAMGRAGLVWGFGPRGYVLVQ
jgi:hypothetical protein